jgi:hypothetical protein
LTEILIFKKILFHIENRILLQKCFCKILKIKIVIIIIKEIYIVAARFQFLKNLLMNNKMENIFLKKIKYLKKMRKIKYRNRFLIEVKL